MVFSEAKNGSDEVRTKESKIGDHAVMVRSAVRKKFPERTVRKECQFERLVALSGVLLLKQRKVDVVDHTRAK